MNLNDAQEGREYIVKNINTNDDELNAFLFSLGCYEGESLKLVSHISGGSIISVKDVRYAIDTRLAKAILI